MARPNPLEGAQEVQRLLVDYAKQETIEPLKTFATYLRWGVAGALSMFVGVSFAGLATLRLLQSIDWFAGGSWKSLFPYLAAVVLLAVALGLISSSLLRAKRNVLS